MRSFLLIPLLSLTTYARHHTNSRSNAHRRQMLDVGAVVGLDISSSTGVKTVQYNVTVSEGTASPDGVERMVYLINGKFPADILTLDQGDDVEIFLTSNIFDAMTLHFHGIDQVGTPWSDGVPGVSQKAIAPGGNFTYRWSAFQHGLYHAHAHRKQMQDDGLVFPIFIRASPGLETPFSQIASMAGGSEADVAVMTAAEQNTHVFMISDWRHRPSAEITDIWHESNVEPLCVDSILINGQGSAVCPSASYLQPFADVRGYGNLTAKGCLPITSPIINPPAPGFSPNSTTAIIPDDMWDSCNSTGVDNPLYTISVDPVNSTWASLGIVNGGGLWELEFSIDEHPMYIYAMDGDYVNVTQSVDVISVPSGVRYQVLIKLDKDPGAAYTIRVAPNVVPQILSGYGILQYASATVTPSFVAPASGFPALPSSIPYMDYSGALLTTSNSNLSANATIINLLTDTPPFPANPPPTSSNGTTLVLHMSRPNATVWAANDTGLPMNMFEDDDPLIWKDVYQEYLQAADNSTGPLFGSAVVNAHSISVLDNDTVVDVIVTVSGSQPAHPIHKHFNKFFVIGQGQGNWTWNSVAEAIEEIPESFNLENPPMRDGFNTPPTSTAAWLALRYRTQIPGPDVLHCHLSQHATGGMVEVLLTAMDLVDLPAEYGPPTSDS